MTNIYAGVLQELDRGKPAVLVTELMADKKGAYSSKKALYTADEAERQTRAREDKAAIAEALADGRVKLLVETHRIRVIEPFYPEPQLIILGGGHIAVPLAEFAARTGFAVTVVDDRLAFANRERFPRVRQVICDSFSTCWEKLHFTPYTYVVIVTRGHRHDLECLRRILQEQWAYAGMIGSHRRIAAARKQLAAEGFAADMLARVNMPIGLKIGAVTPEEIAVSILAQLISYRRLQNPGQPEKSAAKAATESDRRLLQELAAGGDRTKAIATVVATKGSVPRREGAKMLVFPDGSLLGSIGGGCAESEVIREALTILAIGGCKLHHLDLTGEVAEEMGMVCGGTMDVLIEAWPPGGGAGNGW
ncbi:MAG: xanthine dehydrogenase [Firmicutes bacterium]|nr:xanthine dehydrogenase [Bacillota bacterium]